MQNLLKFSSLALLVMILTTACDPDPVPNPNTGPSVNFVSETGFLDADADLTAGEVFKVKISAVSGTEALKTLTVFEDGAKLATDRFDVNGDPAAANPLLVVDANDKNSFTWTVSVTAQDAGAVVYDFEVEDDGGLKSSASLVISIGANEPPKLTFVGDGMFMSGPASLISINITGEVGGAALSTIGVYEDGALITDVSRLRIDDVTNEFTDNPNPIAEGSKDGFTTNLYIRSHETSGALTYTVELTDESGNNAAFDITISSGTPVTESVAVMVSNADGPVGVNGGLDLDVRDNVPSASTDAELRDLGIDNGPIATNWIRQVEAVNGAVLKVPGADQPEGFKYENISSVEAIQAAFDAGTTVSGSTETIEVGDVFLVSNNGKVWILQTKTVNMTDGDNLDFYEFDVKGE